MDAQDRKMFKAMPLDQLALALPHFESQSDMETIIKLREKDFGKNPEQLVAILEAAANNPKLNSAIENTDVVHTRHLDIKKAYELVNKQENNDAVRTLRNHVIYTAYSRIKPEEGMYTTYNPKTREKDSIERLVDFILRVPEAAPHFLQQSDRQKQFSQNPVHLARLFVENNNNLRKTIEESKILDLASPQARYTLKSIDAITTLIADPRLNGLKEKGELRKKLNDLLVDYKETDDGKVTTSVKAELSHDAVVHLYNEVKKTLDAIDSIKTTETMLQDDNLKKNPEAQKKLEQQLKEIKKIENIDQKQTALTNLQGNIQAAIKTELEAQAKKEVAQTQSNSATTPKKQWPTENKENASPQRVRKIKLKPLKDIRAAEEKLKTSAKPVTPRSGFRP